MKPQEQPYDPSELSVVEELDSPEPTAKAGGFTQRREALLGILVIASVLLWAGWQWLDGEHKTSSYQAAEQAVSAKDWDKAAEQFKSASGYRDADKRAEDATRLVAERNLHYNLALEHAARKEGVATLVETEQIEKIQPHYSDTLQLVEQAKRYAYDNALPGVIAMRPSALPPGLYYRVNGEWQWLEGSDAQSRVRSDSNGIAGRVVYDAPDVAALDQPAGQSRRVILATLPEEGTASSPAIRELAFKLEDYDTFNCQSDGVWAFKCCWSNSAPTGPVGYALNYYKAIAFQANDQSTILPIRVPGTDENRSILDIDYAHHQLLAANWSYEVGSGSGSGASPIVNVSVASTSPSFISLGMGMGPGGSSTNPLLLYTQHGRISKAQFSPDGTYALLTTISFASDQDRALDIGTVALVMVDLQGTSPPRVLAQQNRIPNVAEIGTTIVSDFRSTVVSSGPYIGRVVLTLKEAGEGGEGSKSNTLELIDPKDLATPPLQVKLPGEDSPGGVDWTVVQSMDGLLVTAQALDPQPSPGAPVTATMTLVKFAEGKDPLAATLAINAQSQAAPVTIRGDKLLYSSYYGNSNDDNKLEIYRVLANSLGTLQSIATPGTVPQVEPQLIYSGPTHQPETLSSPNPPIYFSFNYGPHALAYSDGGDLYVGTYDSADAVKLESGVTYLYTTASMGTEYLWLH